MDITFNGTIDRETVETVVRDVISDESLMNHDGVDDQIEEYLHDHNYIQGDDYVDSDEVQRMIDDAMPAVLSEDDVDRLIEDALGDYDPEDHISLDNYASSDDLENLEARVESIEDLNGTPNVADLERRFDLYAQRVDELRNNTMLAASVDTLQALRSELTQKVYDLESKVQDLERQLAMTQEHNVDAMSVFDMLRHIVRLVSR